MTEARVTRHWWSAGCFSVLVLAFWGGSLAWADPMGAYVLPGSKAAGMDSCVEPTPVMRRNHMEFIRHQQDLAVYEGIRGTKYSLSGCVNCHASHDASGEPVAVDAPDQFCQACHASAAVTLNCFECHATIPEGEGWNRLADTRADGDRLTALHQRLIGDALAQVPASPRKEDSVDR